MSIFITSDTHFGHENIIKLCGRPFSSVSEMDEELIARWNDRVGPRDEVWHLGDFAFHCADPAISFARLNGRKHLICGNHDSDETLRLPWASVSHYHVLRANKQKFILFHYPIVEWDGWYRGSFHLHGHQHNKTPLQAERRLDVGVDAHDFAPQPIEVVAETLMRKEGDAS